MTDFSDLRVLRGETLSIVLDNGRIKELSNKRLSGASARVLHKGSWGFTVTDNLGKLEESMDSAKRIARALNKRVGDRKLDLASIDRERFEVSLEVKNVL